MTLTVVTGPPFAGKGQFVRDEIARRESDGELGLVSVDYTAIFGALVPGRQSAFRDERVSDTGGPRMASYVYAAAIREAGERELDGYVTTNSPRRAVEIADRIGAAGIVDVAVGVEQVAQRAEAHMTNLARTVARASRSTSVRRCREAGVSYFRERPALVGRARVATRRPRGWQVSGNVQAFDEAAFLRGLTPRGRVVRDELIEAGRPATPADILAALLADRR